MEPDKILVNRFKELIAEYEEKANKYRQMLADELGTSITVPVELEVKKPATSNTAPKASKQKPKKSTKYAKEKAIVTAYFERINTLPTANQLREEVNAKTGKNISVNSFYAVLAELKKDTITIHKFEGNPIATKFLYALKKWHNEDETLKEEYIQKAKANHQGQLL